MGANIDDISQTVVEGYFSVILTATFDPECEPKAIEAAIEANFVSGELSVVVKACSEMAKPAPVIDGDVYMMIVVGDDKPGILKKTTGFLAERSINIEDWTSYFDGGSVSYIGQITVPRGVDVRQLQTDLKRELIDIGMNASIRHENIFRATNEVGPIKSLLR